MKIIIKNISRMIFSLLLVVSIFGVFNVVAETSVFKVTKIEVKEKSDKVTVNDVSLSGGSINNDIVFTEKDDYITYDITIKNVSDDDYTIKSITDDNDSEYLEYTYDNLANVKVNKGESKTFNLTITYKQETSNLTITDKVVSLTLTYEKEDGTTGTETITNNDNNGTTTNNTNSTKITNPKTGDNITIYIILGLVSVAGLVITTVSKKHLSKSLMVIALVSLVAIPLGVKADSESFKILFKNNIQTPHYTITYNANGGKFEDDSTKNSVSYLQSKTVIKKYSHTRNIDDNGTKLFGYGEDSVGNQASQPSVVTIDGASSITVDVYYNTVYDDSIFVLEGAHPDFYTYSYSEFDNLTYHMFGGPGNETYNVNGNELVNVGHEKFEINGDGVTFDFNSEGENGSYGYYAVITGEVTSSFGTYKEPTREGFIFKGWYDDPECTDGHEVDINSINSDKVVYAKWRDVNVFELGDERCFGIGEDCFYVIGYQDDTHVKLLSKYPIELTSDRQENTSSGFTNFSNSEYWASDSNNYPRDVYNENSLMYPHIEAYVDFLKTYNVNVTGRLLSVEDFDDLGITLTGDLYVHDALESAPSWLRGDYWTGVAGSSYGLYRINEYGLYINGIDGGSVYGTSKVRPVIVLEVDN